VEISFRRTTDRKLAEDERLAQRKLGAVSAKQLRNRLADLQAARSVSELVAGQPHPLKGDREGEFAVTINAGLRLVFESADEPKPMTAEGHIDWPRVTRPHVTFIGDYHG
jgi:proteic killer suppression protein